MDQAGKQIFYTKIAKRLAVLLVGVLVGRGLLTPDLQNDATEFLLELILEGGAFVAAAVWAWRDAQKTKQAIQTGERKVEVALALPAHASKEEVEAHIKREQATQTKLPVDAPRRVRGTYDRDSQRFFPDQSQDVEE